MSKGFELYIEYAKKVAPILENPRDLLGEVKMKVLKLMPRAKVYLFGSIAKGKYTLASDIDVLIVSEELKSSEAERLKVEIKKMYPWLPLELHVIDIKTFENWYKKFIEEDELIEI